MSVTVLNQSNGGGLGTALQLWDQFLGLGKQLRQQQLSAGQASTANVQAEKPAIEARARAEQQRQNLSEQGLAATRDATNADPETVDRALMLGDQGAQGPLPETRPNAAQHFFANIQADPTARQGLNSLFPDVKEKSVIPDAWDAIQARRLGVAPPAVFPVNMGDIMGGPGGGSRAPSAANGGGRFEGPGPDGSGFTNTRIWKTDGTGKLTQEIVPVINSLDADQRKVALTGPEGWAQMPEKQQAQAKALWEQHGADFNQKREQFSKVPAVASYLGSGPDAPGIYPAWQDVNQFRLKHTDAQGNWTSDLSPQEATTLVYRLGRIDNPGAIVRQQEFETIANNAGILDRFRADWTKAEKGLGLPMSTARDIYNVVDQLKGQAQLRAHDAMAAWEPRLKERGLKLEDMVDSQPALKEYYQQRAPKMPDEQTAIAQVPVGDHFVLPDGKVGIVKSHPGQPGQQTQTQAPSPGSGPPAQPMAQVSPVDLQTTPVGGQSAAAPSAPTPGAPLGQVGPMDLLGAGGVGLPGGPGLPPGIGVPPGSDSPQAPPYFKPEPWPPVSPVTAAVQRNRSSLPNLESVINQIFRGQNTQEADLQSALDRAHLNHWQAEIRGDRKGMQQAQRDTSILTQEMRKQTALKNRHRFNTEPTASTLPQVTLPMVR